MTEIACAVSGLPSPLLTLSSPRDFAASASAAECSVVAFGSIKAISLYPVLDSQLVSTVDIFDSFGNRTSLQLTKRAGAAASANATHVFVAGGMIDVSPTNYTASVETFSCASRQQVFSSGQLSVARGFFSAFTTADGAITLFAGGVNRSHFLPTIDILDHSSNIWSTSALTVPRRSPSIGGIGDFVVVVGGDDVVSTSAVVDIFNTKSRMMTQKFELNKPRINAGVTRLGDQLYMAGGESHLDSKLPNMLNAVYSDVLSFAISGQTVTLTLAASFLSLARSRVAAATVGSHAVFVGGVSIDLTPVATIDVFNGVSWSTVRAAGPIASAHAIQRPNLVNFVGINTASPATMHSIQCRIVVSSTTGTFTRSQRDTVSVQPLPTVGSTMTAQSSTISFETTLTTETSALSSVDTTVATTTSFAVPVPPAENASSLPAIIGGVVGGVVFLAVVVAIVVFLSRRRGATRSAVDTDDVPAISLQERSTPMPRAFDKQSDTQSLSSETRVVNQQYLNASDVQMPSLPVQSTEYSLIPQHSIDVRH
jgi:hypothetical protein